ncbi:MAG: phosphatase PAP2 family protein [Candidatus Saccharimonadales bacterium]
MKQLLHQFDHVVSGYIATLPTWLKTPFLLMSFIGQPIVTISIGLIIAAFAIFRFNQRLLIASIVALSTMGINTIIKYTFERDRPATEYVSHMVIKSYSFPSGHTAGSTVIFGLLAYLAFQLLPQPLNVIVSALLALLIIGIGVSRVYLGAHFPSDVIFGWILGLVGLSIIIYIVAPTI